MRNDGAGAWKENREYTYKLTATTVTKSSESNENWIGTVYRMDLRIRPKSKDLLLGQFIQFEYADVEDLQRYKMTGSRLNESDLQYNQKSSMNRPFEIHLVNGVIRSLSLHRSVANNEVNLMKILLSSLQVNTNAQNLIEGKDNQFAAVENDNIASYTVMEPIATGNCETIYDISMSPGYLPRSQPELAALSTFDNEREFIKITKTRNNNKCAEYQVTSSSYADANSKTNANSNYEQNEEVGQIIISGSLNSYTIQSSVSSQNILDANKGSFSKYVNLRLQSVKRVISRPRLQYVDDLKDVGSLVYSNDYSNDYSGITALKRESKYVHFAVDFSHSISGVFFMADCRYCC